MRAHVAPRRSSPVCFWRSRCDLVVDPSIWDAGLVTASSLVLAHAGGWDELAFVLVPIALFAGLLALANRRAVRAQQRPDESDHD